MQIKFLIDGEATKPYELVFTKRNDEIDLTCTCLLEETTTHCEYLIDILDGKTENIVSGNEDDVATLKEWLPDSMLGTLYDKYKDADRQYLKALDRQYLNAEDRVDIETAKKRLYYAKDRLLCQVKAPSFTINPHW